MRNLHQDAGAVAGARIVETLGRRPPAMLARGLRLFRGRGRRQYIRHDVFSLELRPAHLSPLNKAKGLTVIGAPWALRHPPGHRSSSASRNFRIQAWAFNVPEERPCLYTSGRLGTQLSLQSLCRVCLTIETVMLS